MHLTEFFDSALVDQTVSGAPLLTRHQFERCGFFCVDYDMTPDKVLLQWCISEVCDKLPSHHADCVQQNSDIKRRHRQTIN